MDIRWAVEDGYVGQGRPHKFTIADSDLEDQSPEDVDEYVNGCIQEAFEQQIGWIRLDNG